MYENGDTGVLEILLQSDNFSDTLNQMEYMEKITEYNNGLLEEFKHLKEEAAEKEKEQKEQLKELKDEKTYEQETIEKLVADKSAEVAKCESNIEESQTLSAQYAQKIEDRRLRLKSFWKRKERE